MSPLARAIRRLIRRGRESVSPEEIDAAKRIYRERCESFRRLIAANSQALSAMADMEEALACGRPFGMELVRSLSVVATTAVFQMIKQLDRMAPDRYTALYDRFREIRARLDPVVNGQIEREPGPMVLALSEVGAGDADETGSKMACLGELRSALGLPVPGGFVITASGYSRFMEANDLVDEIRLRFQTSSRTSDIPSMDKLFVLSSSIRNRILAASVPAELADAVEEQLKILKAESGPGLRLALRSSALGEDGAGASFAGQYHTELNVSPLNLLEAYKQVVASKYTVTAMTYRYQRGIPDGRVAMCVGVMRMVDALAGGVAYTVNPLDRSDKRVFVMSVPGLPKSIVDGRADSDLFTIERGDPPRIVERAVALKETRLVCDPVEGVNREEIAGESADAPSIDDGKALEVAGMALAAEAHFGQPQDVEWAVDESFGLMLLQSRPLGSVEIRKEVARTSSSTEKVIVSGGITACPGAGAGGVVVVRKDADTLSFPKGAVLVASHALPAWAPLLSRASAVVTEHGSAAGHLANVAREFGVPAIVGLPHAIDILEEAGEVTVDADNLVVVEGRREELLAARESRPHLMEGSLVHEAMKQVLALVAKLNLKDPSSPRFRAGNVETMHDITRFCHEKAVEELFSARGGSTLVQKLSKRLMCGQAMQYWIVDLDDGLASDVPGDTVTLEEIACKPMLALWRGMNAVAWEGPPPVDAKGFFSVMMESTMCPDLDPAATSGFTDRNYFLITRDFVNLQSRFGYHFSTVEAVAGERSEENYAGFQFKGGAASRERRVLRTRLMDELLTELGFIVETRGDALFARIEGGDEEFLLSRLTALGYLIIHTRQLDMVMGDSTRRAHEAARLRGDLRKLFPPEV